MSSGYEEISFGGGDPDREPWLQAWVRAHARLLAVCFTVAAVLVAAGAGGRYLYERSREPLPPPDAPFPAQVRIAAHLCGLGAEAWACRERREATEADGRAVEERMRAMPELAEVVLVSREEDRRRTLAYYTDAGEPEKIELAFLHARVEGTLRRSADFAAVAGRLKELPGVNRVLRVPTDFWAGRADFAVHLCGTDDWSRYACPKHRPAGVTGSASAAEKQAVLDRIWDLPGAEAVHLESRDHRIRLLRHYHPERPASDPLFRFDRSYETFYVRFSGPADLPAAAAALKSLPGVRSVAPVRAEGHPEGHSLAMGRMAISSGD
ncbi:permease-like cell division protein FtsX [Planomonospora parontospora]|uniref:permease-like cell division protein FtsX n=1 Tax=Planomonospora parontospora TaxID=58119 RepID=UPI001670856A|nr:permease-like cell division protein FtsX [Planomonospora parontospora]GGL09295.1 hypothetical protein GCM10014719_09230 [Planomonospora parontospora subsp. antibiotica]GII14423.1 hypothetical protein Ppa05_11490 [Planomonospora parontospora subsp. antibiotica]